MATEDEDILQEFKAESYEHLSTFEEDVLRMEEEAPRGGAPREVVDRAFRSVHTIKGSAGFLGLERVVRLAHAMETVLNRFRESAALCTASAAGALLKGADLLRLLVEDPEACSDTEVDAQVQQIESSLQQSGPAAGAAAVEAPAVRDARDTVRLAVSRLDSLMNLAGELVLARNRVLLTRGREEGALQSLDRVTTALQDAVMRTRMRPLHHLFERFPRVVRDLAAAMEKKVELKLEGGAVELDRSILEALSDPLVHVLRNAVGHGLEPPEARRRAGKPEAGMLRIRARQESGHVIIEVTDDGAGIDVERVSQTAVARGLATRQEVARLEERDILEFLFQPGFSTASEVTEVSGRGVGMDVVRAAVERMRGDVELSTNRGKGTTIQFRVPLTLAIVPALAVWVQKEAFVIPETGIVELVRITPGDPDQRLEDLNGADVLWRRGELLPVVRLADVLGMPRRVWDAEHEEWVEDRRHRLADRRATALDLSPEMERRVVPDRRHSEQSTLHLVILRTGAHRYGLVVEEVGDIQETVIKPVPPHLGGCRVYGGATILADGSVALVLDPVGIAATARLRFSEARREEERRRSDAESQAAAEKHLTLLLFRYGGEECFAIPAEQVSRIDLVVQDNVVRAGGQKFIRREESVVPLLELEHFLPVSPPPASHRTLYALGCRGERAGALLATEIEDSVSTDVPVEKGKLEGPGIVGTVTLPGRMAILLDPAELFERRRCDF